jgi:type IV pilus assembly protein PilY1
MKTSRNRTAWAGAGLLLTLLIGAPAYADDVELLLSNPNSTGADKPNILFILDSSGSMGTIQRTQEPYINSNVYPGSCDPNRIYWTEGSTPPSCSTDQWVSAANFVCVTGNLLLQDSGQYTDTMAQYRERKGDWKWRRPNGDNDELMECESDSGLHGGGDPANVYARIGTNQPPFTNSAGSEVDWGSSPTERIITAFSGNYMNWYNNSPVVEMTRTDIVKTVTKNVLASMKNANVGLMRFNYSEGGVVNHAIKDLDSNRAAANAQVDALPASGWTPLAETMYEAALYWRGMAPLWGSAATDPAAYSTNIGGGGLVTYSYNKPANYACAKNFNVLLTDGEPTQDLSAYSRVGSLPGYATTLARTNCTGGNVDGACLDDVAEYLSKVDINGSVPGEQTVTTYTIGFTVDLPILKETAENSGGEYYLASDVKSLTAALTDIVTNIFDRDVSFTAPAVSVNAFNRTQHLNDLYISVFRAKNKTHWPGNMKKYRISKGVIKDKNNNNAVDPTTGYFADGSHSYWTAGAVPDGPNVTIGGAASQLPDPSTRRLFTNKNGNVITAPNNAISPANAASFSQADFGLTGAPGEPSVNDMIQWARGVDVRDQDNNPSTMVRRDMGDTLHSQPASIVYGESGGILDVVVYTATNDGYLHAIDANTGKEIWSFIPEELLGDLGELYADDSINYKHYGIDGDIVPVIMDKNKNGKIEPGTDNVFLIFGMRRGGDNYYALDVTDKNTPHLQWIQSRPQMGQTWSPPVVAKVDVTGVNSDKAVLIMGGGYDTTHDQPAMPLLPDNEGAGIFMLDLYSGAELWRAGIDPLADLTIAKMKRSIPSRVRVLDISGDGFADRMYAVDVTGQLFRFDIKNGNNRLNLVDGGVVASMGAEGKLFPTAAETRRFYAAPDVSMFLDEAQNRRYLAVSVGSGYRAHPLNNSAEDRFYSFRDPDVFNKLTASDYLLYDVAYDDDFVEVRGTKEVTLSSADRGWKFTLPPGERILVESQTFDDAVYFVSFQPQVASVDPCQAGLSVNRLYKVSVRNGDPVVDLDALDPNDPDAIDDARVTELEQGGIAPKPMFLFPSPDDPNCQGQECAPPPIGCVGVECFDPGYANNPVRTLWTQDGIN